VGRDDYDSNCNSSEVSHHASDESPASGFRWESGVYALLTSPISASGAVDGKSGWKGAWSHLARHLLVPPLVRWQATAGRRHVQLYPGRRNADRTSFVVVQILAVEPAATVSIPFARSRGRFGRPPLDHS